MEETNISWLTQAQLQHAANQLAVQWRECLKGLADLDNNLNLIRVGRFWRGAGDHLRQAVREGAVFGRDQAIRHCQRALSCLRVCRYWVSRERSPTIRQHLPQAGHFARAIRLILNLIDSMRFGASP